MSDGDKQAELATREYVVQAGDTVEGIAERHEVLGGARTLAYLNGLKRPEDLKAGMTLKVPLKPVSEEEARAVIDRVDAARRALFNFRDDDIIRDEVDEGVLAHATTDDKRRMLGSLASAWFTAEDRDARVRILRSCTSKAELDAVRDACKEYISEHDLHEVRATLPD